MRHTNDFLVDIPYSSTTGTDIADDEKENFGGPEAKQERLSFENELYFDKKRKKQETDMTKNNTPPPVELKKMKFGIAEGTCNEDSDKLFGDPHLPHSISFEEAYSHYKTNLQISLPDCESMFPWLHDFEDTATFLDVGSNTQLASFKHDHTTIIKSFSPLVDRDSGSLLIENSGILKGSLNANVFFQELTDVAKPDLAAIVAQEVTCYNNIVLSLGLKEWTICDIADFDSICNMCYVLNVLPLFKSDSLQLERNDAMKSQRQQIVDPSFFRRFDIQACKMLLLSTNILLYCYHDSHNECQYCNALKLILHVSYYNLIGNYKIFGDLNDSELLEKVMIKISIIDMRNIDANHPFVGTPLLPVCTLDKPENQLVSKFDAHIINNWEKDLIYREKLEISKISSNSKIEDKIWVGNSIDYEVSKMGLVLSLEHRDYFTIENSICGIEHLDVDSASDMLLFNFPEAVWDVYVQCTPLFGETKLFDKTHIENALLDYSKILIRFPASGTLGLGNLTLNLIKQIFQCIDIIYQLSHKGKRKVLIHSQDGYSESSFLMLAYIIYAKKLSLKEAILHVHSNLKRPFFIFPNDLEVLNYLQILLIGKANERESLVDSVNMEVERFEITNEDFTNMFFNTSLLSSSKSDLNCLINLKGPLPSQILEYLYLGSLKHAENLNLLKALKINCVVSVGEKLSWLNEHEFTVTKNKTDSVKIYRSESITVYHIDNLLDNGQDPLLHSLTDILQFIEDQRRLKEDSRILVHCMVGVSRSATVVIAEVMKELKISILRAYIYVRVRRLNIIIQPNLLFLYELLKYEENLVNESKIALTGVQKGLRRSIDWATLSQSIEELNEKYLKKPN